MQNDCLFTNFAQTSDIDIYQLVITNKVDNIGNIYKFKIKRSNVTWL